MHFSMLTSTFLLLVTCAASANAAMDFSGTYWIWGSDVPPGTRPSVPKEQVALRKNIATSPCNPPTSVEVIISADDGFTLYVNGAQLGSGLGWASPGYFCISLLTNPLQTRLVVAVLATNDGGPAGVIAKVKVNYFDGGSAIYVTDNTWVNSLAVPTGFQSPNYDDSNWQPASIEQSYENSDWRPPTLTAPAYQTCSLCSTATKLLMNSTSLKE